MKIDPTIASIINSYRNLAQLWRTKAESACSNGDIYRVAECVKNADECERKARQLEQRYIIMELDS